MRKQKVRESKRSIIKKHLQISSASKPKTNPGKSPIVQSAASQVIDRKTNAITGGVSGSIASQIVDVDKSHKLPP